MTDTVDMRILAETAAKAAVEETLLKLGIDAKDPLSAQRDFVVLREMRELMKDEEFQADLAHIRRWRKAMEGVQVKGLTAVVTLIVTGVVGLMIAGVKGWIKLP